MCCTIDWLTRMRISSCLDRHEGPQNRSPNAVGNSSLNSSNFPKILIASDLPRLEHVEKAIIRPKAMERSLCVVFRQRITVRLIFSSTVYPLCSEYDDPCRLRTEGARLGTGSNRLQYSTYTEYSNIYGISTFRFGKASCCLQQRRRYRRLREYGSSVRIHAPDRHSS